MAKIVTMESAGIIAAAIDAAGNAEIVTDSIRDRFEPVAENGTVPFEEWNKAAEEFAFAYSKARGVKIDSGRRAFNRWARIAGFRKARSETKAARRKAAQRGRKATEAKATEAKATEATEAKATEAKATEATEAKAEVDRESAIAALAGADAMLAAALRFAVSNKQALIAWYRAALASAKRKAV